MSADSENKVSQDRLPRKKQQPQSYGKRILKKVKVMRIDDEAFLDFDDKDWAGTNLGFMGK